MAQGAPSPAIPGHNETPLHLVSYDLQDTQFPAQSSNEFGLAFSIGELSAGTPDMTTWTSHFRIHCIMLPVSARRY